MRAKFFSAACFAIACYLQLSSVSGAQEAIDVSPPVIGTPTAQQEEGPLGATDSPLVTGVSFSTLANLVRQASTEAAQTRGAKEIALYRRAAPAVVLIKSKEGSGTGIVLPSGLILTNRHVVEGVGVVQIFFKMADANRSERGIETRVAHVKAVDPSRDLAIVQADSLPAGQPVLSIAPKDVVEIGADVYAIGHPLGYEWTFTQGIVSGIRRINEDKENYVAIQTQTPINPGNSGGPLLNSDVEVVGVNTWARDISKLDKKELSEGSVTFARPAQGLNFAVSAKDIREFLSEFESGKIATLSLNIIDVSPDCWKKPIFEGRNKNNDAQIRTYSMRCDGVADAWKIEPDSKSSPVRFHFDPDRTTKSTIVVLSNSARTKWELSFWDLFKDNTFAVLGKHEDGSLRPTKFEFTHS